MKAYLAITGTLFGLLAVLHGWRTVAEWKGPDVVSLVHGPGLGVFAAALSIWGWRLFGRAR